MKRYLFIMQQAPHDGLGVQESLDMLLTTAAFDQSVAVLFLDQGVLQLKDRQQPEALGQKDIAAIYQSLAIYDVNTLIVEEESLQRLGLEPSQLILPVQVLPRDQINRLMKSYDFIIGD